MAKKAFLANLPSKSGVYLMKDAKGKVLYVGKAKNIARRIKQYFGKAKDSRPMVPLLTGKIDAIDTLIVPTEKDALLLENTLIKKHQPPFNVLLKDDKTYISLMINHRHEWPQLKLIRVVGKPKTGALYFGPYTSASAARKVFELLLQLFPLRQCSDEELRRRTRPCLLYGMKRCPAPCVGKCDKKEYAVLVDGAIAFLKGHNQGIVQKLTHARDEAAASLEFEKAAVFQQTLSQISHVTRSSPLVVRFGAKDCDVFALYREGPDVLLFQMLFRESHLVGSNHFLFSRVIGSDEELLESFLLQLYQRLGQVPQEILLPIACPHLAEILKVDILCPKIGEKKALITLAQDNAKAAFAQEKTRQDAREELLLELEESCKLLRYPSRIECFDTSHIAGDDLVASQVSFTDGLYDKKRARTYLIRGITKPDDYGALHQVLTRRLLRAKEENDLPDLLLIDGGKGQLQVALNVFQELEIASVDLIAIAKEKGRHDKGLSQERLFLVHHSEPICLPPTSPLLFFLQRVRDEAHRKALQFHLKRRSKRLLTSKLDGTSGLGPVKKRRLLKHFGSVEKILAATDEELGKVRGITPSLIKEIKQ